MKKIFLGIILSLISGITFAQVGISPYSVSEIEFTPLGSTNTIRMGRIDEIGKFRLSNKGRKDVFIDSIFLRNFSNADIAQSFQSYSLYANNNRVLINTVPERRGVTLIFSKPFALKRGRSTTFSLKAQLIYAKRGKSVQLGIRREEDFNAYEKNTYANAKIINIEDNYMKEYTLRPGGIYYRSWKRSYRR